MIRKTAILIFLIIILLCYHSGICQQIEGYGKIGYKAFLNSVDRLPAFGTSIEVYDGNDSLLRQSPYWKGIFENIKPGKYKIKALNSGQTKVDSVDVRENRMAIVNFLFDFETGNIHFVNLIKEVSDSKAYGTITNVVHKTGEPVYTGTRAEGIIKNLPVGEYEIRSQNSGTILNEVVTVEENITKDVSFEFDLGKGRIAFRCFLDSLLDNAAYGAKIMIYRLPYQELITPVYENQWRVTTPFLPAGDYAIIGTYQNKTQRITTLVYNDSTSNINLIFDVQNIRFSYKCYRNNNKEAANGAVLEIFSSVGQLVERGEGWRDTFFLTEGNYSVRATYLGQNYNFQIELSANEGLRIEREFILE